MATQPRPRVSVEEYLAMERAAHDAKCEFFDGEVFAMAGASATHNLIVGNIVGELRARLKGGPCTTYPSDLRVKVSPTGLYTYPDAVVVCGKQEFEDAERDTLLNPTLLVEVLSPSTEAYDRGRKSQHYRRLTALREYLLVWQDQVRVEHYVRQGDERWLLVETTDPGAEIELAAGCVLPLREVYDRVEFPPAES